MVDVMTAIKKASQTNFFITICSVGDLFNKFNCILVLSIIDNYTHKLSAYRRMGVLYSFI